MGVRDVSGGLREVQSMVPREGLEQGIHLGVRHDAERWVLMLKMEGESEKKKVSMGWRAKFKDREIMVWQ